MRAIVVVLLLVFSGALQAKSVDQRYVAYGVGTWSCDKYGRAQQQGDGRAVAAVDHFVEGYLSAFNVIVDNTYDIMGGDGIELARSWLRSYCRDHAQQSIANAMAVFTSLRYPDRSSVPPPDKRH